MDPKSRSLVALRPRVLHVAPEGAYERIFRTGLSSTRALLESAGWEASAIEACSEQKRDDFLYVDMPDGENIRLSHQRPINVAKLRRCLEIGDGTTTEQYFRLLSERVFLFAKPKAASGFLDEVLKTSPVDVLYLDSLRLLREHGDRVEVSTFNSGSTPRSIAPKGRMTWMTLHDFDRPIADIQEITVKDRITDVEPLTVKVVRVSPDGRGLRRVWP